MAGFFFARGDVTVGRVAIFIDGGYFEYVQRSFGNPRVSFETPHRELWDAADTRTPITETLIKSVS